MKKIFALPIIALIVLAGCSKKENKCNFTDSTVVAPAAEQQALQDSLTALGIHATLAPAGFFYNINQPGSGPSVTNLCTTIAVFYRGGFLNGTGFDSTHGNPAIFQLGQVIPGWQKAIPLVAKSGDITLYIPPSLGYGANDVTDPSTGKVVIPANSNLVFHVVVADIQ
ncbi:MAG TPA: FKBP-type peptidyl-prolyl cis-trans isomerase [Hanamia sp.]|nr:FKBP-type peptidyl-prolyl cis-trans isomerase [Hanamia sp.]